MVIDPNLEHGMTYKDVRRLCNKVEIKFKNQSFSHLVKELKRYSLPMIMYGLETKLINESDIKHVIYSSLTIPKNYYYKFIDYLDGVMADKSKLAVNSMIGCFKPKVRENWRSLLITINPNIAYYQVYDRYFSNK